MDILIYTLMAVWLWEMIKEYPIRTLTAGFFCLLPLLQGEQHAIEDALTVWFIISAAFCFWRELGLGALVGFMLGAMVGKHK